MVSRLLKANERSFREAWGGPPCWGPWQHRASNPSRIQMQPLKRPGCTRLRREERVSLIMTQTLQCVVLCCHLVALHCLARSKVECSLTFLFYRTSERFWSMEWFDWRERWKSYSRDQHWHNLATWHSTELYRNRETEFRLKAFFFSKVLF